MADSIKIAEAAKVIENTQRDLNIAFVNELSLIFKKMDISTEKVLKAAETKWNFISFRPGLVGGHCIGVDPYYLTYKSKQIGHNPKLIHVLDGGLKKWIEQNKDTTNTLTKIIKSNYKAIEKKELVKNKLEIDKNIFKKEFDVIDARNKERFEGKIPEPRKGLKSGSIENSFCLPFSDLINIDGTFISKDKILEKFQSTKCDLNKNLIFSCGSGVTASVLALAYSLIDNKYMPTIYDGSWSEYGKF